MFADVKKSKISFVMKTNIPVKTKNRCPKLNFIVYVTVMIGLSANFGHVIDHSFLAIVISLLRVQL